MNSDAKLQEIMQIIEKITDFGDSEKADKLLLELREITGNQTISVNDCLEYWGWTSLEELARSFCMPEPDFKGLTDEQLAEIIRKISECQYSESEMDFQLKVLEKETGLSNISDYIFYPDIIGFDKNAEISKIITKILADRIQ
ncbi:MAG: hypothetical protein V3G42_03860 [Oscillospiraceae bacterium]